MQNNELISDTEINVNEPLTEKVDRISYEIDEIKYKIERILMHQLELCRRLISIESQRNIKSLNDKIISDIEGLINTTDKSFNKIMNNDNLV